MRIVFVMPVPSHVRFHKRIDGLKACGIDPVLMSFERDYYKDDRYDYIPLGRIKHRSYLRRITVLLRAIGKIRRQVRSADVIYTFGLDNALVAWLATRNVSKPLPIIYEVGDIMPIQLGSGLSSKIVRGLERFILKRVHTLVVTAQGYIDGYYCKLLGRQPSNVQVIENKLLRETLPRRSVSATSPDSRGAVITIGYFGVLRCRHSWEILRRVVERSDGRVRVLVRGHPLVPKDLVQRIEDCRGITYGGAYRSPEELPDLYQSVDIIWACFPVVDQVLEHWRWARTNRFYESLYFYKPMVSRVGSADGAAVDEFGVGICVDPTDIESAVEQLMNITRSQIDSWRERAALVPEHLFVYTDEHRRLYGHINNA